VVERVLERGRAPGLGQEREQELVPEQALGREQGLGRAQAQVPGWELA